MRAKCVHSEPGRQRGAPGKRQAGISQSTAQGAAIGAMR